MKPHLRDEYTLIGIIGELVDCAALIIPGFGTLGGPAGPSGVIKRIVPGLFKQRIMSLYAMLPSFLLEPLIIFQPHRLAILEINSASRCVPATAYIFSFFKSKRIDSN